MSVFRIEKMLNTKVGSIGTHLFGKRREYTNQIKVRAQQKGVIHRINSEIGRIRLWVLTFELRQSRAGIRGQT
jgi:hypothetical protein